MTCFGNILSNEAMIKKVHEPHKEYAIWLNFEYVVVYLKILRLGVFRKSGNFCPKYRVLMFLRLNCWYCHKE